MTKVSTKHNLKMLRSSYIIFIHHFQKESLNLANKNHSTLKSRATQVQNNRKRQKT